MSVLEVKELKRNYKKSVLKESDDDKMCIRDSRRTVEMSLCDRRNENLIFLSGM